MKCPFCEADLSSTARKCRHCGEWVKPPAGGPPAQPAPAAAPAPPGPATPPQQNVTVNVPQEQSVTFAVVTLLLYIFLYPIGLILNLVGLITGPRRGCFLTLLLLFVILPAVVIFIVLAVSGQSLVEWVEQISNQIRR